MITVKKEDLLEKLTENRKRHREIFLEAQKGYREEAIRLLDKALQDARNGRKINTVIYMDSPVDQTKDYDRVIGMLTMATDTEIDLSESDYAKFVMDDWGWKEDFLLKNSLYTKNL